MRNLGDADLELGGLFDAVSFARRWGVHRLFQLFRLLVCEPCEPSRSRKTGAGLLLGWACQLRKSSRSALLEQSYGRLVCGATANGQDLKPLEPHTVGGGGTAEDDLGDLAPEGRHQDGRRGPVSEIGLIAKSVGLAADLYLACSRVRVAKFPHRIGRMYRVGVSLVLNGSNPDNPSNPGNPTSDIFELADGVSSWQLRGNSRQPRNPPGLHWNGWD